MSRRGKIRFLLILAGVLGLGVVGFGAVEDWIAAGICAMCVFLCVWQAAYLSTVKVG